MTTTTRINLQWFVILGLALHASALSEYIALFWYKQQKSGAMSWLWRGEGSRDEKRCQTKCAVKSCVKIVTRLLRFDVSIPLHRDISLISDPFLRSNTPI